MARAEGLSPAVQQSSANTGGGSDARTPKGAVSVAAGSLTISELRQVYGDVAALDGIDLEVPGGGFTTLLGPSGSGKSTLLKVIAGFENPRSGAVTLDGADLLALPPERRPVNMVFQRYALFPHRDVRGNIAFGLEVAGAAKSDIDARVSAAIEMVRLTGKESRKIDQLSGGEQQRVALARAIVNRPQLLLLDEPLGALDLQLRRSMQLELRQLHKLISGTFIFVTHDQEEALAMSDRIVVMRQGRIEQVGSPLEVYEHPASRFVAGFVGETNLLEGVAQNGQVRLNGPGLGWFASASPDGPVTVSIRPERLSLLPTSATPTAASTLSGRIEDIIFLGPMTRFKITVEGQPSLAVVGAAGQASDWRAGDAVQVSWNFSHATVLNN